MSINGTSFDTISYDPQWIAALGVQTVGGEENWLKFYGEVEVGLGNPNIKQNWGVNAGLRWSF